MKNDIKIVNCGCGGEAHHDSASCWNHDEEKWMPNFWHRVICENCGTQTKSFYTEAEAITAWNKAMGAAKDDIAIAKGTWMMEIDGFHCSVCFYKCETTALPDVCPFCGTKMKG